MTIKEKIADFIREIKGKKFTSFLAIAIAASIIILLFAIIAMIPLVLIGALSLMGIPINMGISSWIGASLFLLVIRFSLSPFKSPKK